MSPIALLLDPGMQPFTGALMLVMGFLIIELVLSLLGASMMGDGPDAPGDIDADLGADFDADPGADFGADFDADFDAGADPGGLDGPDMAAAIPEAHGLHVDSLDVDGLDAVDAGGLETDAPEAAAAAGDGSSAGGSSAGDPSAGGLAGWLGFGQVPFILWLSGLLTAFGLAGYLLQVVSVSTLGAPLGWPLAAAVVLVPSLAIGGRFARLLGRLLPKTESSAINRRSLGGRRGIVVQGTARRGRPAQARVRDGFGNWHYVRIEPVDDDVAIPARTEVLVRDGRGPVLLAIPLDNGPAP